MAAEERSDQPYKFSRPSESEVLGRRPQRPPVYLPGFAGIPVRGGDPVVDPDLLRRYVTASDVHFRVFDMTDASDLKAYETLMSAAATNNQHVLVIWEVRPEGFGSQHWKIAVKWCETYLQPPSLGRFISTGDPLGAATE